MWLEDLYKVKKPVIAMLHLDPLPGDVRWNREDSMVKVLEHAKQDLNALQEGAVDAVLISNEFSLPYEGHVDHANSSAMAYVIGAMRNDFRIPFGVDCIGDGMTTIELAAVTGASFVREGFSGAHVGHNGLSSVSLTKILKRRKELGSEHIRMLYFLNPEADKNLNDRPYDLQARSLIFEAIPDGLCVSADGAGMDVGCKPETIEAKLSVADGAVVGTYFKADGKFMDADHRNVRIDPDRVKKLMGVVRAFREKH